MSNPLYEVLRGSAPAMPSPGQYLSQLKANPLAFIRQAGFNIPNGIQTPQQMIGYLLQSGQVPQARLAQAQQAAMNFRR
jgi:hypothetical protein